ncbi:MAG: hypothetical protein ABIJ04_12270 [Bacteroidota bacterium]
MEKEDFTWYGGVALRYISGYGSFQYIQKGDDLMGYTALSPIFEVDYNAPTPSKITKDGLRKVGDIGFHFISPSRIVAVRSIEQR